MPLYEYQCDKCGVRFELIQKFSDDPLSRHETCGGDVRRLVSAPALQFKGSGWYITDYARPGSSASDSSGSEGKSGDAKAEPAATTKSESKSEAKSPSQSDSKPASN